MTKTAPRTRKIKAKTPKAATSSATATATATALARPGGKLGLVVEQLEGADGAMLSDLVDLTGWQKHTVRAALTRLRQRGFAIRLEDRGDRRAYRLDPVES
jgi:DNA-binding MarR family transcriptional regulator